jgi:diguanylate cyclase
LGINMTKDINMDVRRPSAYTLALDAVRLMQQHDVWPTPTNYEIWLYVAGDPECPLAQEVMRLIHSGTKITEDMSDYLAHKYISRLKINDEVRQAGLKLNKELAEISDVIQEAQHTQKTYGQVLNEASTSLKSGQTDNVQHIVDSLSQATIKIVSHHTSLEKRLAHSALEISRLRKHLDQVRLEAMTDALTNLANRKAFDEQLEKACEHPSKPMPLTLAVVDIDHFKRFNDTWGHQTGDQVLRYVSSVLARLSRSERFVARYGGEEFSLLFPQETMTSVEQIMNEVRKEIASRVLKRRSTNEDLGTISISVGLAEREIGEDSFSLMDRADTALYASKNKGRNQVSCASRKTINPKTINPQTVSKSSMA